MIPQPVKWVGLVLVLAIVVLAAAPMAVSALRDSVSFSDDGGILGGGDDDTDLDLDGIEVDDPEADADADGGADLTDQADGDDPPGPPGDDADSGADEDGESYVVQSGDTLYSIASEVYGDGGRWPEIAEANDIDDRTSIRVGQELAIP